MYVYFTISQGSPWFIHNKHVYVILFLVPISKLSHLSSNFTRVFLLFIHINVSVYTWPLLVLISFPDMYRHTFSNHSLIIILHTHTYMYACMYTWGHSTFFFFFFFYLTNLFLSYKTLNPKPHLDLPFCQVSLSPKHFHATIYHIHACMHVFCTFSQFLNLLCFTHASCFIHGFWNELSTNLMEMGTFIDGDGGGEDWRTSHGNLYHIFLGKSHGKHTYRGKSSNTRPQVWFNAPDLQITLPLPKGIIQRKL